MRRFSRFPFSPRHGAALAVAAALLPLCTLRAEPPKVIESPTTGTAGKATLTVTDSSKTQTLEADGRDVAIEGNDNKITVSDKCHALTVNGNGNEVTLASVVSISTPGNHNRVTYTQAADGETVQVTNVGKDNTVGKPGK